MSIIDIILEWKKYRDNTRGQATPFTLFFLLVIFNLIWALFLAEFITTSATRAIGNGATGLEAFLWSNLNLIIFASQVILIFAYAHITQ